jgi:hypothetical protein
MRHLHDLPHLRMRLAVQRQVQVSIPKRGGGDGVTVTCKNYRDLITDI